MRLYLERGLAREPLPVKLWYFAPMFRFARAQRGRYREHWQFGVEAVGSDDPAVDAEVIALQASWYRRLGLRDVRLLLNSIGDETCRPAYRARLVAFLDEHLDELSAESRERRAQNPLRIFDSKDEGDRALMRGAPRILDHLCPACRAHLEAVQAFLDARGVAYELDPGLVRGLDYYERTAWEFQPSGTDAAQSSIAGGGRYDGLAALIGGPRVPGVGFGSGVERLVLLLEEQGGADEARPLDWYLAIEPAEARPRLHALLDEARVRGLRAEADLGGRSLKGQLRQAGRQHARVLGVVGADEWQQGVVRLGDDAVPLERVVDEVVRRAGAAAG
jgi:histidyl-tRNA synthetase